MNEVSKYLQMEAVELNTLNLANKNQDFVLYH